MGLFRRRDLEVVPHEGHFSVAGAGPTEPLVDFEVVEEDEPAAMAPPPALPPVDPIWRWRAPGGHPPAFPPTPPGAQPRMRSFQPPPAPQPAPAYVTPRPVREPRPEMPPVQTEWARRAFGPLGADRVRGMCSGCGTMLSVARAPRPLRTACPVCGRTRVLS